MKASLFPGRDSLVSRQVEGGLFMSNSRSVRFLENCSEVLETSQAVQTTTPERSGEKRATAKPTVILEVNAAYNRECLQMPKPNGPNGRRVLSLEMLLHYPFYWEWPNERETEEVLMELYVARTRRMQ